jgi:hypothetical protein
VQALNDLFTGHRHASTKRRFLGEAPWSPDRVMRRLIRLVPEHAGFSKPSRGLLVIGDAILAHDSDATAMEKVAAVWDPATERYVTGHVVVTAHWVTPRGHVPVGFRFKTPGGLSKHHLALWLITKCRRFGVLLQAVVFDSWYLADTLTGPHAAWGVTRVSRLKSDRVYLANGGRRGLAQLNSAQLDSFDLVVLMMLANTVQNATIGNDNSMVGGWRRSANKASVLSIRWRRPCSRPAV